MKTLLLLLMAVVTMTAADLTGNWSGTVDLIGKDGASREESAAAELKQSGDKITGTIGPPQHPFKVTSGKLTGNKLALVAEADNGGVVTFDLTLTDDRLEGNVVMKRGDQTRNAKLKLKKA